MMTRKGVTELRGPALVCLRAIDKKISVLVFLMGQNPKCPGYNIEKNQRDKFKYIVDVYSFHNHRWCWPIFMQYSPTMCLIQKM